MKQNVLVMALFAFLLAAGIAYAAETTDGPPDNINVDGAIYYADGAPAEKCTTVITELYGPGGELKYRDERCTGQGFPPAEQFYNKYKLALAGRYKEDVVVVKALGVSNSSVAAAFVNMNLIGSRPGIISDIGHIVNYVIGEIIPKEQPKTGEPQAPTATGPSSGTVQPPAISDETAGASFLLILAVIIAALILLYAKRKKSKKKGIASYRFSVILLLVAMMLTGVMWYSNKAEIFTLESGQVAIESGHEAANQTPSGKQQIIVEGGFPTGAAVEGEEGGGSVQAPTNINVNNNTYGFAWGPNGEKMMNTTWSNYSYVSDGTDANPCGNTCNPANGNCTLVNVSLVKTDTGVIQDSKKICTMQGYPNAAQFYYRFKTVVATADGVAPNQYTVNVTGTNGTFQGKNQTVCSGSIGCWVDVILSQAASGVPPVWSNNQSAYPSVYSPTNVSNFTLKWTDNGAVSTVVFESNFSGSPQNYTMALLGDGFYNYNNTLPAGNFYWKSYATDNSGDQAVSDMWYFIILQADNPTKLFFRNSTSEYANQDMTVTYGTPSNATATAVAGATLYRNDTYTGGATEVKVLGANVWAYKANATGNQNYSANFTGVTYYLYVNQASNILNLNLNGNINQNISVSYGTAVTSTGSGSDGISLYRNGAPISNGQSIALAVSKYDYKVNSTGNTNYTVNSTGATYSATVTAGTPALTFSFNPTNSVTYGTQTNVTCSITTGDAGTTLTLFRNGTQVGTGAGGASETNTLGAGLYNYTCIYQVSENYTIGYSYNNYLTVTPAAAGVLAGTMHVLINGTESDRTYKYENVTNVTGYATITGQDGFTFNLYRNAISMGSNGVAPYAVSNTDLLGANTYTYIYNTTGNQNYSAASVTRTLTIEKKTPTLALSTAGTVSYGAGAGVSGSATVLSQSDFTISLYVNSAGPISTDSTYPYAVSDNTVYGANGYTFTLNNSASANYTAASTTAGLTVYPVAPTLALTVMPSNSTMYPTTTTATGTVVTGDSVATTILFRNGTNAGTNTETIRLGAGPYNYTFWYGGSQNYTALSLTNITIIQQNTTNLLTLYINNGTLYTNQNVSIAYGTSVTVQGLNVFAQSGTVNLYRNGTGTTNPVTIILGGGEHSFKTNSTGNNNYTTNATGATYYVIVNKAMPTTSITFNPSNSVTYGTPVTTTCSITIGDPSATLVLFRNGTQVNTSTGSVSETATLGAGTYNYSCAYQASENYTYYMNTDVMLTVAQAAGSCSLTISPATPITYGTATNASCSCTGTPNLYRNHSAANAEKNVNIVLPAGFWNYTCNSTASGNTTGANISQGYQVNQAVTQLKLLLNGTDTDKQYMNSTFANFTITTGTAVLPVQLFTNYSDGINKPLGNGPTPFTNVTNLTALGVWNFTAYFAGDNNYTANFTTHYATVGELRPNPIGNITVLLNKTSNDVILNWTLSNSSDVYNYIIYATNNYDAGFNFNNPYATVSNTSTNWTDPTSDGVNERYYVVRANNSQGQTDLSTYTVGKWNLHLYTGWNLISIPLIVTNSSLNDVIYTADDGDICNNWTGSTFQRTDYFGGFGWSGDFSIIGVDNGYWYNSLKAGYDTTPFNVTIVGIVPTTTRQELIRNQSWSILGWTSIHTKTLDSVLTAAKDSDLILLFSAPSDTFQRTDYFGGFGWFGDFGSTEPGRGYWYYSQNSTTYMWSYQP